MNILPFTSDAFTNKYCCFSWSEVFSSFEFKPHKSICLIVSTPCKVTSFVKSTKKY